MKLPSRAILRQSWKTFLALALIGLTGFSIGVYANKVVVQNVQPVGGNHIQVPAPELQVLNSMWSLELNSSLVTGLILNVTTSGPATSTGSKIYQIAVEVSCIPAGGTVVKPNCAIGTTLVNLPVNMGGSVVLVPVGITPAIDPESTEIDNLSFIVTSTPADMILNTCVIVSICWTVIPFNPPTPPHEPRSDFTLFINNYQTAPFTLSLSSPSGPSSITVTKIVQALNGYSGTVTLSASFPPDLAVSFVPGPNPVIVPLNGAAPSIETISTTTTTVLGMHMITNIATDGIHWHTFPVFVNVIP